MTPKNILLVTGEKHAGKTTLIARFLDAMTQKGLCIRGILARGLWKNNLREGFDLVDLSNGATEPLARRRVPPDPACLSAFEFFQEGMAFGRKALSPERCRNADILIVDEVGKLEARGLGWSDQLEALLKLPVPLFIWSVRKESLEKICWRFGIGTPPVVTIHAPRPLERLLALAKGILDQS